MPLVYRIEIDETQRQIITRVLMQCKLHRYFGLLGEDREEVDLLRDMFAGLPEDEMYNPGNTHRFCR